MRGEKTRRGVVMTLILTVCMCIPVHAEEIPVLTEEVTEQQEDTVPVPEAFPELVSQESEPEASDSTGPVLQEPEAEASDSTGPVSQEPEAEVSDSAEPVRPEKEASGEPGTAEEAQPEEELLQVAYADVVYRTHCQTYGWLPWVSNGEEAGITGQSKRMEAMNIKLENPTVSGSIEYRTHCQTYGWLNWVRDGALTGTTAESKRLEAIEIRLTGEMGRAFDVYYRVHCQTFGWMGWAKNGEPSGSSGFSKRLEAIEICLVRKGGAAPGSTADAFVSSETGWSGQGVSGETSVEYCTHVQTYGWQEYVRDGQMSGTSGESKRLEGIRIRLKDPKYDGTVQYCTHVQTYGWQDFVQNGAMSGTEGESKRLEAIRIRLTGEMAEHYDIYYRVHCQTFGWMGWARNGEASGTAGYAKRLEGIEICLVKKGGAAPGSTADAYLEYTAPVPEPVEDTTVMSEANWQVLINVIGAVESGGQIYGNRDYGAYAGRYAASPYEYTCTLGWAQFYGAEAQKLVQNIFNADPAGFRAIDAGGVIERKLSGNWVGERWDPSPSEKNTLIRLITSPAGRQQQDLQFRAQMTPIVSCCENTYTGNAKAVIMFAEIAHLGGLSAAKRIFGRCGGNYSTGRILESLKWDQSDYSNSQQVGDYMYDLRHARCAEFVERYVR